MLAKSVTKGSATMMSLTVDGGTNRITSPQFAPLVNFHSALDTMKKLDEPRGGRW